MTPLDAVAAAIRERLLAGRPAPLPGLGTLVRQHVASRIQERADGSRMLMPPGETIGLAQGDAEHESLAQAFGRFLGFDGQQAHRSYSEAMDQIEARLAATGEVRLPGVGLLRRTSGGVILGVEADLLAVVNRTYEGLAPVGAVPAPSAAPSAPPLPSPATSGVGVPGVEVMRVSDAGPVVSPELQPESPAANETPSALDQATLEPDSGPDQAALADGTGRLGEDDPADAPLRDPTSEDGATSFPPPDASQHGEAVALTSPGDDRQPDAFSEEEQVQDAAQPGPMPEPEGAQPPEGATEADTAFVDEATLDADLDELAVPFGEGAALRDVLPATPPERDPNALDSEAASPSDLDEEIATTLVEPTNAAVEVEASSEAEALDGDLLDESSDLAHTSGTSDPEFVETASYTIDEPMPVGERPGPSAELSALLAATPDEPSVPDEPHAADSFEDFDLGEDPDAEPIEEAVLADETEDPTAAPPRRKGGFPWWLVALALILALALLLAWLWPRLGDRPAEEGAFTEQTADGATPTEPARTDLTDGGAAGSEPPVQSAAGPLDPTRSDLPAPTEQAERSAATASTASGGGLARDPDPLPARPGLGQAPAAGYAISPPRVAGLPAADVRAMSGRSPVDAEAQAWTLVVLSTASRDDASALSARYRSAGYRTGVLASDRDARPTFRVAIGQFADRAQARRLSDRLPPQAPADSWPLDLRTL